MIFNIISGDLFSADKKYSLAHCISADYALGAGIAIIFEKKYHLREKLKHIGNNSYPQCIYIPPIFNLITKEKYWNKPTYNSIRESLEIMKTQVETFEIKYLAMPKIGCGLDKLDWNKVEEIIKEVFQDIDCEILIYKNK
jgi:hypothetical protein